MSKIFTGRGDNGLTGLLNEGRVKKNSPIPSVLGSIDEANAALALARASTQNPDHKHIILTVQRDLYHMMAEVSASPNHANAFSKIDAGRVSWIENQIDSLMKVVPSPDAFIIPGDTFSAAALDLARTIVRRAERDLIGLTENNILQNPELIRYLNRLSSLCFALELVEIHLSSSGAPTLAQQK